MKKFTIEKSVDLIGNSGLDHGHARNDLYQALLKIAEFDSETEEMLINEKNLMIFVGEQVMACKLNEGEFSFN